MNRDYYFQGMKLRLPPGQQIGTVAEVRPIGVLSAFEQLDNAELRAHIERVGQEFYQRADVRPESAAPAAAKG